MSTINRPTIKTRNAAVLSGIDKHIPASITLGGTAYTLSTLKAVFQAQSAAIDAADAQHKAWADAVAAAKAEGKKANATYASLRSYVIGQYGKTANAILNDFGMSIPKPVGVKTVQAKSTAAAKRAATRVARHTMGKKQRKSVTGMVSVPVPAVTAPAPVATPAAPSPAKPASAG
ncbi:MAG: hypothetical protein ACREJ3_13000 [Polyangiaceae bacterium]